MLKFKTIIMVLLALPLVVAAGEYKKEIEVLNSMTAIMNEFADRMENATEVSEYITACDELADGIEKHGAGLVALYGEHPDWSEEPPAEVKEPLTRHMEASKRYEKALQKAVKYANNNMDNEDFQASFKRLNKAIYEMYQ
ncbi:MAG: hypothetical protein ACOC7U_06115 [Spirochaetota bacterium]